MITFTQLPTGTPPDIEITTDDSNAELVAMSDAFETYEAETGETLIALSKLDQASIGEEGTLTFVIPGEEASAAADAFEGSDASDALPLAEFLEEQNERALDSTLADGDERG